MKENTEIDTFKILRDKLPSGYLKIIFEKTGFSKSYISDVAYNKKENNIILDALMDLAEKHQENLRLINERIKNA